MTRDARASNEDGKRRDSFGNLPSPDSESEALSAPELDYDMALSLLLENMSALDSCFHNELSTVDQCGHLIDYPDFARLKSAQGFKALPNRVARPAFYLSVLEARHVHEHGAAERVTTMKQIAPATEASSLSDAEEVAKAYVMAQMYVAHHLAWAYGVLLQPLQPASEQDNTPDRKEGRHQLAVLKNSLEVVSQSNSQALSPSPYSTANSNTVQLAVMASDTFAHSHLESALTIVKVRSRLLINPKMIRTLSASAQEKVVLRFYEGCAALLRSVRGTRRSSQSRACLPLRKTTLYVAERLFRITPMCPVCWEHPGTPSRNIKVDNEMQGIFELWFSKIDRIQRDRKKKFENPPKVPGHGPDSLRKISSRGIQCKAAGSAESGGGDPDSTLDLCEVGRFRENAAASWVKRAVRKFSKILRAVMRDFRIERNSTVIQADVRFHAFQETIQHFIPKIVELLRDRLPSGSERPRASNAGLIVISEVIGGQELVISTRGCYVTVTGDQKFPVSAPGHKAGKTALTPPPPVVPRSSAYIWLALPHNVTAGPNEAVVRHRYNQRWLGYPEEDEVEEPDYAKRETPGMRVQVARSHPECLQGPSPRHLSPELTCFYKDCKLIEEAEHFIYIENQFFISSTYDNDEVKNQIAGALVKRIIRAAQAGEKIQVIVTIPGFSGNIMDEGSLKIIMAAQYRTINRGGHSIYAEIRKAGFEPYVFTPPWIGNDSDGSQKEVTISLPVETKEGIVRTDKTPPKTETVPIPESEDAARRVIEKFEAAAKAVRGDEDVADNVARHMLHDRTSLLEEKWLGSEQEELDAYVSELLYIHTKLMIVDDKRVISEGDGDSEIALAVEDGDIIRSTMNGKPYEVARSATSSSAVRPFFCAPLCSLADAARRAPWPHPAADVSQAHRGDDVVHAARADAQRGRGGLRGGRARRGPAPEQMVELWNKTARKNREIFTEIFRPVPTNLVRDWEAYDGYVPKVKAGHVVPGIPLERVKKQLSEVIGALVECPLDFLVDQKEFVEGPEWKGLNPTLPVRIYNAKESAQVLWLFKVYRKQDESNGEGVGEEDDPELLKDLGADLPKRDRVEPARCEGSDEL
ncbi:hypothetical protein B0H14DRAFT_3661254 [Mycena olivaceomarginata]|nr:hypothetical protein B0H14DRAFT_3661254 [Mycena olivaceomarginata]